jgi:hypothetical protein
MYVLAAGAADDRAIHADCSQLDDFYGAVAGLEFNNADLGLFVFQYGLDLLDLRTWRAPGRAPLAAEAAVAAWANYRACREWAGRFVTYRDYWGLSAGDGPGEPPADHTYRAYAPAGPVDGTAHVTATLASVAHVPELVLASLHAARRHRRLSVRGRYGFSSLNLDRAWVGPWMVGIDAGAAILALENFLGNDRVRSVMHRLPCVQRGLKRLGFAQTAAAETPAPSNPARLAS